ncbi:hypothetical protein [Solimonas aquatica]|nr:hypothetical protein [Solimonas aquatica]
MLDKQMPAQEKPMSVWQRLACAFESFGESFEERLERRLQRLEEQVSRLSEAQVRKDGQA